MKECHKTLVRAAMLAPSGDNTQPWRFLVNAERNEIGLLLDSTRDPSPMNAGQRMARVAIGAALENMMQTAERNGWNYELGEAQGEMLATMRLGASCNSAGEIDPVIRARTTNRKVYDARQIQDACLSELRKRNSDLHGIQTNWITGRDPIEQLTQLIARADATMFGAQQVRDSFLAKVRFDAPANAVVEEGLSLGSLEASAAERFALRVMSQMPQSILKAVGAFRVFASAARRLLRSASGICLIATAADSKSSEVQIGRAMQRAWLALTAHGLSVQPMMSLLVLQNIRDNGTQELVDILGRRAVESLLEEFERFVRDFANGGRPAAILRFGYASQPTTRTGRLPMESVVQNAN